jgi:hypothetical protein
VKWVETAEIDLTLESLFLPDLEHYFVDKVNVLAHNAKSKGFCKQLVWRTFHALTI